MAKDEIIARTDRNPIVFCETNHAFCWSLINPFQKALREQIPQLQNWKDKLEKESEDIQNKQIVYKLGYRSIKNGELSLHHDDIIDLTIKLLEEPKFRQILIE
ncbi:TPA: ATP-dependent helicase, partial [Pasteurella multocida]|nr:ATP-dependent helicase [Pasteurella multocida]